MRCKARFTHVDESLGLLMASFWSPAYQPSLDMGAMGSAPHLSPESRQPIAKSLHPVCCVNVAAVAGKIRGALDTEESMNQGCLQ